MKVLLPILILGLVVIFFFAVIAPARARRAQRKMARKSRESEQELREENGSRAADWTARALGSTRKAGDKTFDAGRSVRDKLPGE